MSRLLSILLAFLILISNFGFALGTHFCGGKAVESKLLFHKESLHCGMDEVAMSCDDHSKTGEVLKNKCCENDILNLDVDDTNSHHPSKIKLDPVVTIAFVIAFLEEFWSDYTTQNNFASYDPPPIVRSAQSFFQVFII